MLSRVLTNSLHRSPPGSGMTKSQNWGVQPPDKQLPLSAHCCVVPQKSCPASEQPWHLAMAISSSVCFNGGFGVVVVVVRVVVVLVVVDVLVDEKVVVVKVGRPAR